jgi:5-methylcytosine-specific restriction endonuclease McrA
MSRWSTPDVTAWRRLRAFVLRRDNFRCQLRVPGVCRGVADTVDHLDPPSLGHPQIPPPDRLTSSCRPCNASKSNRQRAIESPHAPLTNW